MMRFVAFLACGLILAGCAATPPAPSVTLAIPDSLKTCAAAPAVPSNPNDQQLAEFILDLSQAGADCRSKLGAVVGILP